MKASPGSAPSAPPTREQLRSVRIVVRGLREGLGSYFGYPFPARAMALYRPSGGTWHVHDPQCLRVPGLIQRVCQRLAEPARFNHCLEAPSLVEYAFGDPNTRDGALAWLLAEVPDRCLHHGPVREWVGFASIALSEALEDTASLPTGRHLGDHRSIRAYAPEALRATLERHIGTTTGIHQIDHDSLPRLLILAQRLSIQREEGKPVTGRLLYLDRLSVNQDEVRLRIALDGKLPAIANSKHFGKLMAGASHDTPLVIRGQCAVGYGDSALQDLAGAISIDFTKGYGLIRAGAQALALVRDGQLLGCGYETPFLSGLVERYLGSQRRRAARRVAELIARAASQGHGATVVVDVSGRGRRLAGHALTKPLNLNKPEDLEVGARLSGIDGAVVLSPSGTLTKFAALLDGSTTGSEDLARGARYNTAWRYSDLHRRDLLIVVSSDGPVTVFAGGEVVYPLEPPNPMISERAVADPTLEEWLERSASRSELREWRRQRRLPQSGTIERVLHDLEQHKADRTRSRAVIRAAAQEAMPRLRARTGRSDARRA